MTELPKVEARIEALLTIADHVHKGQIKNLVIKRYKSGTNKGKLFAEYSLKEPFSVPGMETATKRQDVAILIRRAATALSENKEVTLLVTKLDAEKEEYTHRLEITGGVSA